MKKVTVHRSDNDKVCLQVPLGNSHATMERSEALQLTKDLLDACGASYLLGTEPGPSAGRGHQADSVVMAVTQSDVSSGMSLYEIRDTAHKIWANIPEVASYTKDLALLVANLAARVDEIETRSVENKIDLALMPKNK